MLWLPKKAEPVAVADPAPAKRRYILHPHRMGVSRVYEAAKYDRHTEGWFGDYGTSSWTILGQLQIVRNRAREMAVNDPFLRKIISQRRNNIVGAMGFRLVMDVADYRMDKGQWTKFPDFMANDILQRDFREWKQSPEWCDIKGRKSLAAIIAKADKDYVVEGESIIEMVPGATAGGNPYHFALRRIRPDSLAVRHCAELSNGNFVYNGVEVDCLGRAAGYWFYTTMLPTGIWGGDMFRVPADLILHRYDEDYEDQHRGFPVIACVLRTVKMLHQYHEAELIKARRQAYSSGTYTRDPSFLGETGPEKIADPQTEDGRAQFQQNIEPGEDRLVPVGYKYDQPEATAPNPNMPTFGQAMLRQITSGTNATYHSVAQDFGSINWSAGRLAEADTREGWKFEQQEIIDTILRPMFRRPRGWLAMWLASGNAKLPFSKLERFRKADTWKGKRWPLADPSNEVPMMETFVRRGWASDEDYSAEFEYGSFAENVAKTKENDRIAAGTAIADRNAPKAGAPAPEKKTEEPKP